MMSFDFRGRVALITGGTAGIGRATALAFARAGASVVITARGEGPAGTACAAIEALGAQVLFVQGNTRDEADVMRAVRAAVERFGRLDFAINNAGGGGGMAPLEHCDQGAWDDVMATTARGTWLCMRHEIPAMLEHGGGAIVNICSIYGAAGKAALHAYVAAKHAVLGMTRSVALEYATRGVRVNALCPGATRTESMERAALAYPELVDALVREHPMQRMATTEEVASAALYLCSEESAFVTGAPLFVDGGFMAA